MCARACVCECVRVQNSPFGDVLRCINRFIVIIMIIIVMY